MPGEHIDAGRRAAAREHLLVLRAQLGERDAHAALFDRHGARVRYYLGRLAPPWIDLDDLLQELWLRVLRGLPGLRDPGAFQVWLYRTARNLLVARMRRRRETLDLGPQDEVPVPDSDPVADESIRRQDAALVHGALAKLPEAQQEALTLRFLEGLDYEQIAAVVGCRVGTVRSRIHYGKARLEQLLGAHQPPAQPARSRP